MDIVQILLVLLESVIIIFCCYYINRLKRIQSDNQTSYKKIWSLYMLSIKWIQNTHAQKKIDKYFSERGIHNIVIYGMGDLGRLLYEELVDSSKINVLYAIDRNANEIISDIKILYPDEKIDDSVEAIIVTPIFYYNEVKESISLSTECQIISLLSIIYEM